MILPRASLKRSFRTRTRENATSVDTDIVCPPLRSSSLARQKTRPPPLQIIPELSETILDLDLDATHSPATARPFQFISQQPESVPSRVTLSAYTFSIDDALLMFGGDAPRSPALSASSSTSDGASSEDVPTTPRTSDEEDGCDFILATPRLCPQRVTIRPLCITKTRSLIFQDDEDIHSHFDEEEDKVISISRPTTEEIPEHLAGDKEATEAAEQDFYTREFENFISLPATFTLSSPARRDSLILVEALPAAIEAIEDPEELQLCGRSRHSKPLPLLPPVSPAVSSLPSIPTFPLMQTTAQNSVVRRKRNIQPLANHPPPPPEMYRPLPRMAVPLDIESCVFPEETLEAPTRNQTVTEQPYDVEEDASIHSYLSFTHKVSASVRPLPPAVPGNPLAGMYGEIRLPRSSTDSDAPRSSVDSTSSFVSSTSSNTPVSPLLFPSSPCPEERLRSRWSSSTLASLAAEPSRGHTLFSPLKSVFGSRSHRVPPQRTPPHRTPPKLPKNKRSSSTTPSPPKNPSIHISRQGSRSSTSSAGTSSNDCDSHDGSPSGPKRKPLPMAMFLRTI